MAISQKGNILNKWEFGLDAVNCTAFILLPVWDFSLVRDIVKKNTKVDWDYFKSRNNWTQGTADPNGIQFVF